MPFTWVKSIVAQKFGDFRGFPENLAQFPEILGQGREFGEFRLGIFGDKPRKSPNFGDGDGDGNSGNLDWGFLGINPENPRISGTGTGLHLPKGSGTGRGRGQPKFWGFFGEKSPKIVEIRGGDGGKDFQAYAPH